MKLVKLDFGAEVRRLENFTPHGSNYYEVECPFCGASNIVQTRNFHKGVRCRTPDCQAMLYYCMKNATKDKLPKNETIMFHGLRGRAGSIQMAQNKGGVE
jgi:hypothetical protein